MTVKSWGKGRPDYYKTAIVTRPVILPATTRTEDGAIVTSATQTRMITSKKFIIAAGGTTIDNFYTVPSGNILSLGGGYISVKDSCINKLRLTIPNLELIGEYRFDTLGDLSMTALAGQEVPEGAPITAYIFNNDSIESEFSLLLAGVLNRT